MSFFKLIYRPLCCSTCVVALLCLASGAAQAQSSDNNSIVVVVRRGTEVEQLRVEQVSRIFLGLNDTLPNGAFVTPVDAPESSALYQDFYTKVIGKTAAQIKAYRARQSFTGTGIAPQQAATSTLAFNLNTKASSVITYTRKRDLDVQHHVVLDTSK
jgi:hypothetical protein